MHHTCANYGTVAQTTEIDLPAITDQYMTITNNHFLPQRRMRLLYTLAAGVLLTRSRISSPSLLRIVTPDFRDVNPGLSAGNPMIFADYSADPLTLEALEEFVIFQTDSAATSESNAQVTGLEIEPMPQPAGNVYTIRGTATGTLVAGAWTNIGTITWQQQLPTGIYAVVGGVFFSATGIAGRFIFENTPYRPGGLAIQTITARTDKLFRFGGMGVWGQFHNYAMPQVEMLASAGDTAETVFMDIMKIG